MKGKQGWREGVGERTEEGDSREGGQEEEHLHDILIRASQQAEGKSHSLFKGTALCW